MKVFAISASPRAGGNSDQLCEQFLKGAAEAGHQAEKIRLAENKISPCIACDCCAANHSCIQKDDMAEILQKMVEADVIVLATPVYFYSMASQMKILIDRCYSRFREITGKQFYFIVTAADPQHEAVTETLSGLRSFLRCLPDSQECGIVYGTGTWDKGDVLRHPSYESAYQLGKKITKEKQNGKK